MTSRSKQPYSLALTSAVAFEIVEIIVNGKVVQTLTGIDAGTSRSYTGAADLLRGIDVAEKRAKQAYGERPMPRLYQRFEDAHNVLGKHLN